MGELRVRLLGGLEVEGRTPAEIGSRKARTLLAALACARGAARPAEVLAEVVWGDDPPARPAEQLGVLVSRLRGALGAACIDRVDAGFRLRADWLDLDELDRQADAARAALAADDPIAARLAATMGLDLVRGPVLPEHDGEWVIGSRLGVQRTVAALHLVAAESALRSGDGPGAAAAAAAGLDHDPYDEAALRVLMRAHVAAHRPASALAAYVEVKERLAEDLGVSPDAETEALHDAVVLAPVDVASVDRWDPFVARARAELAATDFDGAWRDAEAALRRGSSAAAHELAGWVAYYRRDIDAALEHAEAGAAASGEEERRSSCRTLVGRIRHSLGDLSQADANLSQAVTCPVPGVRAVAEVWLGSLRNHQGRPEEALELGRRGAVDAAAVRHPFVIPQAYLAQAYALGQLGRVEEAFLTVDEWGAALDVLALAGDRYRPACHNFRAWLLRSVGDADAANAANRAAIAFGGPNDEPWNHAALDLAAAAIDDGDPDDARRHLADVGDLIDGSSTMAWHQRQRIGLLGAEASLLDGDAGRALAGATAVVDDAGQRGSARAGALAAAVALEARARLGEEIGRGGLDAVFAILDRCAALESWRHAARLASVLGDADLWGAAVSRVEDVANRCGPHADRFRARAVVALARLGGPAR